MQRGGCGGKQPKFLLAPQRMCTQGGRFAANDWSAMSKMAQYQGFPSMLASRYFCQSAPCTHGSSCMQAMEAICDPRPEELIEV